MGITEAASQTQSNGATAPRDVCDCCGAELPHEPVLTGVDRLLGVAGEFEIYECSRCGTGTTRPYVADAGLAALYQGPYPNHSADVEVDEPRGLIQRAQRAQLVAITHSFPLKRLRPPRGRLLDVGCGNAAITRLLQQAGWDVVGIEPDPAVCEVARPKIGDVRVGDIKTAPLDGEQFNAIMFNHTLEHVAHPSQDLARAWELLAPGGTLMIAVPHFGCWERRAFGDKWLMLELPRHRTHFTARGLTELARSAGFEVDVVKSTTSMGILPASVVIALTGHSRFFESPVGFMALRVVSLLLRLPTALFNTVRRDGEVLGLVARRPA